MLRNKSIIILEKKALRDVHGKPLRGKDGFPLEKWEPVFDFSLRACVRDQTGSEFYAGGAVQKQNVILCNIAHRDGINERMRVRFRGEDYEILRIYRADYRRISLDIDCRRIAREGS